jgi:hypothetical protein
MMRSILSYAAIRRAVRHVTIALGTVAIIAACSDPAIVVSPPTQQQPSGIHVPAAGAHPHLSVGVVQTCVLRPDGVMQCWGAPDEGAAPALQHAGIGYYTALGAGRAHTCAVRIDGAIECFGDDNVFGYANPLYVPAAGSFVDVGGGNLNTCGLRDDGVVECFGDGNASPLPVVTADVGQFTQLGVGAQHGCALRNDGAVQCWGGYPPSQEAPHVRTATTGHFTQVTSGSLFSCALRNDGAVECWGYGAEDGRDPPLKTAATGHFTFVNAGDRHACAIRSDGKIECWGLNNFLQAPALKVASNGGRFVKVDGGFRHTCGLRDDLTVQCWGMTDGITPGTSVLPTATLEVPSSIAVNGSIPITFTNAQVPGYPNATSFTYAFACLGNGHFSEWSSSNSYSCPTTTTGTKKVYGLVRDEDGAWNEFSAETNVVEAPQATADLKLAISTASLSPDLRKALTAKLNAALDAIAKGKTQVACTALQDFINQVNAQRGKAITIATADLWIQQAIALRQSLGC